MARAAASEARRRGFDSACDIQYRTFSHLSLVVDQSDRVSFLEGALYGHLLVAARVMSMGAEVKWCLNVLEHLYEALSILALIHNDEIQFNRSLNSHGKAAVLSVASSLQVPDAAI